MKEKQVAPQIQINVELVKWIFIFVAKCYINFHVHKTVMTCQCFYFHQVPRKLMRINFNDHAGFLTVRFVNAIFVVAANVYVPVGSAFMLFVYF